MRIINIITIFIIILISPLSIADEPVIKIGTKNIDVEDDIDIDSLSKELLMECYQKNGPTENEIEKLIEKSRNCRIDSDCTNLFIGELQSPFGCSSFAVNKKKASTVSDSIQLNKCNHRGSCFRRHSCDKNMAPVYCNNRKCDFKYVYFQPQSLTEIRNVRLRKFEEIIKLSTKGKKNLRKKNE